GTPARGESPWRRRRDRSCSRLLGALSLREGGEPDLDVPALAPRAPVDVAQEASRGDGGDGCEETGEGERRASVGEQRAHGATASKNWGGLCRSSAAVRMNGRGKTKRSSGKIARGPVCPAMSCPPRRRQPAGDADSRSEHSETNSERAAMGGMGMMKGAPAAI